MARAPAPRRGRAGFSLLEAIVVLAITSMVLVLIFQVASRSSQTGFRLGKRALSVADSQLGADTVRVVLKGMILPSPAGGPSAAPGPDLQGTSQTLTAGASFSRATPCGGPGAAGVVSLSVNKTDNGWIIACQGVGAAASLVDLKGAHAALSYSTDGRIWGDSVFASGAPPPPAAASGATAAGPGAAMAANPALQNMPGGPSASAPPTPPAAGSAQPQRLRLLVRLTSDDGRFEVIEMLNSEPLPRPPGVKTPAPPTTTPGLGSGLATPSPAAGTIQ